MGMPRLYRYLVIPQTLQLFVHIMAVSIAKLQKGRSFDSRKTRPDWSTIHDSTATKYTSQFYQEAA